jgi:hypothetical protein
VLVVTGAGFETAVQDADQPVAELTQRGVVTGAAGAELVVVGPRAGRSPQCAEGLLMQRVGQAPGNQSDSRLTCGVSVLVAAV